MEGFNYPAAVQRNLTLYIIFCHSLQKYTGLTCMSLHPEIQFNKLHIMFIEFEGC